MGTNIQQKISREWWNSEFNGRFSQDEWNLFDKGLSFWWVDWNPTYQIDIFHFYQRRFTIKKQMNTFYWGGVEFGKHEYKHNTSTNTLFDKSSTKFKLWTWVNFSQTLYIHPTFRFKKFLSALKFMTRYFKKIIYFKLNCIYNVRC